jgi:hypothetical protein
MQRNDVVAPAVLASSDTNVAHDTDQTSSRNQSSEDVTPDCVEFVQELVVFTDVPQLPTVVGILLEGPVGRRRYG